MSEAHGERRHQQRPRGEGGEESRHRRNKESQGEHTREHAKQVNTHTGTNVGLRPCDIWVTDSIFNQVKLYCNL